MVYTVSGKFRMGSSWQNFNIEVKAINERASEEKIYAELGSRHKVKRRFIKLDKISGGPDG